jgi:DNA polymerase-3 subunit delta'
LNFEGLKITLPIPPHENRLEKAIELTSNYIDEKRQEPFRILSSSRSVNIPIAFAREIKKSLSLKAGSDITRVVIFYQMEEMKFTAADALLKMIEEPPADTIIILICDNPESLLPTIQSRSQNIKINSNSTDDIQSYLIDNYELTETKASLLSNISEGSIGRALELVDVHDESQRARRSEMFLVFKSLFNETGGETLAHMNDLLNFRDRSETMELLRLWQLLIRDCSRYAVMRNENEIINIDFKTDIIALSQNFPSADISTEMTSNIKNTLADLDRNVHIQGALMALALKLKKNIKTATISR